MFRPHAGQHPTRDHRALMRGVADTPDALNARGAVPLLSGETHSDRIEQAFGTRGQDSTAQMAEVSGYRSREQTSAL
jgi:hypothetical protein